MTSQLDSRIEPTDDSPRPCYLYLVVACLMLTSGPMRTAIADTNSTRICNQGTASLYFAILGELDGLFQSGAMVQGLVEVTPDGCANVVPDGMNKVIVAFFIKNSRGVLTNPHLVPTNATSVNDDYQHICVNMQQPYRLFGSRAEIYSKYVNVACPDGFSPAAPAWLHKPGGRNRYNVEVHANDGPGPWKDKSGQQYKNAPVLRVGPLQSGGPLIEVNQSSLRDYEMAQVLIEEALKFKEKAEREAAERQARVWAESQRQREAHEARVVEAEEALTRPSDAVCAPYAAKDRYKKGTEVAISGVQLGMDLDSAHEALICNGFTMNPEMLARAGGVDKFWAYRREKTFQKTLADGTAVFTDVETLPPRGAPAGADFVVMSVRVRYQLAERLSPAEWQRVRSDFKTTFPVGKRSAENDIVIHRQFKVNRMPHLLQLNAEDFRDGTVSRYSISIL